MRYEDGQTVHRGDNVRLWGGEVEGKVVCSIDTAEYSADYPSSEWSYLKKGVLIVTPQAGLIHFAESEPSLKLVSREPVR